MSKKSIIEGLFCIIIICLFMYVIIFPQVKYSYDKKYTELYSSECIQEENFWVYHLDGEYIIETETENKIIDQGKCEEYNYKKGLFDTYDKYRRGNIFEYLFRKR